MALVDIGLVAVPNRYTCNSISYLKRGSILDNNATTTCFSTTNNDEITNHMRRTTHDVYWEESFSITT